MWAGRGGEISRAGKEIPRMVSQYSEKALTRWKLGREEAPEHFFRRTAITYPDCQEFMVWRIFSVVTIFIDPLMDEFTLMEVF